MKRPIMMSLGALAVFAFAPPAVHAEYGTDVPLVASSSSALVAGGRVTLAAANFCPGGVVTFSTGAAVLGSGLADRLGDVSVAVTAPSTPGTYTVTGRATTPTCSTTASLVLAVVPPAPAPAGRGLPSTGANTSDGVRVGAMAVLLGAGLFGVASYRRRSRLATSA